MRNSYSLILIFATLFMGYSAKAQLYIDGAGFYIQNGATVTVQGNVTNNGTLTNNGNLRVQGDFLNSNQLVSTDNAAVLEMYGTGNSNLNVGSALLKNLIINKSAAGNVVSLTADAQVTQGFTFTQGGFITGPAANPNFILSSPTSAVYSFVTGKEVIGNVRRTGWVNGSAAVFNQTNMLVTTNAGAGSSPTSVTVTMIPNGDPTQTEREVKRKFNFSQTGGSGFTADIRYPYATAELNTNLEGNLVPWKLVSSEWNAKLSPVTRDAGQDWINTTGITAADFAQEWKLADPNYTMNVTAYLRGPWNGASMNTNIGAIMQTTQPYNVSPFNYTGTESVGTIPANVVDWVLIENRKPASGLPQDALASTITGSKAGFILNNGSIVGLDGITPISVPITKQGSSFIVIRHRNHLGVISNSIASNAVGTFTNDFSLLANVYKPSGASSDPVTLLSGGVKYGLWAGDVNKNGLVNSTDVTAIKAAISGSLSGYQLTDVNLSNGVNSTDLTLTKNTISLSGTGSGNRSGNSTVNKIAKTNIPDPITED